MTNVIVTLNIMPVSPEVDLKKLESESKKIIADFAGKGETKTKIEPVAFGLNAVKILFVMDEAKGATDELESKIASLEDVNSVEVTDVRRAIG